MPNKLTAWLCLCAVGAGILFSGSYRKIFYGIDLPIIAYHNFSAEIEVSDDLNITPGKFRSDLLELKEAGYTAVFFSDIIGYYEHEFELPDKPVLVTFDDGYASNREIAFPILKELNMKATIFILGINAGRESDAITGEPLIPHFSAEQAREMVDSGLVEIQTHTYNLHRPFLNMMSVRDFLTRETYKAYLTRDTFAVSEYIREATGASPYALAYPYGYYDKLTEQIMRESGVLVTVTSDPGINRIHRSKYGLYGMKRIFPSEDSALDMINAYVSGRYRSSSA
ncbi:MAG: polysaccharide deacetylase family protein [Clostridiales bacterium]|jgi:peptidoglycan/xylan/chitin deacetylase (PgdA/CDA1 family)|nr:polysaccharide deacetylase family protein [Clostridiales bacterium]